MQLSPKKVLALIVGLGLPVVVWAGWVLGDLARPAVPGGSGAMGDAPPGSPAAVSPAADGRDLRPGQGGQSRPQASPSVTATSPAPTLSPGAEPEPTPTPTAGEQEQPSPEPTPSAVPEESPTAEPSPSEPPSTPEASPSP